MSKYEWHNRFKVVDFRP